MPDADRCSGIDFEDSHRPGNVPQRLQYFLLAPPKPTFERELKPDSDYFQTLHSSDNDLHFRPYVKPEEFECLSRPARIVKISLQIDRNRFYAIQQGWVYHLLEYHE
jgi:hypothetical protein